MTPEFDRLFSELNPEQKQAVTAPYDQPLLALAGAGSGKTRILTLRIAHLISHHHVPPFHILGVTFTNKAADEMKKRVARLVNAEVWISTFHSTCLRILKQDGSHVGLERNFTIYDDYDQLALIKECLKELAKDEQEINPKGVREEISRSKDFLLTPAAYREQAEDGFEHAVAEVYELYEQKLKRANACDFGDLIYKTVLLFDSSEEVLRRWRHRFQFVLIDEYQDTNHAQYRLVQHLASHERRITVVGDPDQSIYAWRGADIRNILNFENDYSGCHVVKLEQNYRSSANILQAANSLIESNLLRKPKSLWTERPAGEKIVLYEAQDEKDEAAFVVREVLGHQEQGRTLAEMVVFYRLHAQSRVIEEALRKYKIPYRIVGGIRFYDRKEIKDLIAYLKIIMSENDELSLKRVINTPNRGIGKKSLESLEDFARKNNLNLNQTLKMLNQVNGVGAKAKSSLHGFFRAIELLRKQKESLSVSALLKEVLQSTGYQRALEMERTLESQVRLDNIKEFFSAIHDFEADWVRSDEGNTGAREFKFQGMLAQFLETISLTTDLDGWDVGSNSLTLMTLHSAKGLEFPIVYMVGMEEEIFPHVNVFSQDSEDLEEERRLCYVGMTRAKEKLTFTYANSRRLYGTQKFNLPSRFLSEIPSTLLSGSNDWISRSTDFEDIRIVDDDEDDTKRRILFD